MNRNKLVRLFTVFCISCVLTACSRNSDNPLPAKSITAEAKEEIEEPKLIWSSKSDGISPMDCTVELLQYQGLEPEEETVNTAIKSHAEEAWKLYETHTANGEDWCREKRSDWKDLWAYPMTAGSYLNAVFMIRERNYFTHGVNETRDQVISYVYDSEQGNFISLEDALSMAETTEEKISADLEHYISSHNLGTYDGIDSIAHCIESDGIPCFLAGVKRRCPSSHEVQTTFLTWKNGVIEWTEDHPVFLYKVDMEQDGMACQRGMGQYEDS